MSAPERYVFIAPGLELVGPTEAAILEQVRHHGSVHGCFYDSHALLEEIEREVEAVLDVAETAAFLAKVGKPMSGWQERNLLLRFLAMSREAAAVERGRA